MGINENALKYLYSVKGTALNKGKARTWIERRDLSSYGFSRGTRVNIHFNGDGIVITATPEGSRKVAGRDTKTGEVQILDICYPAQQRLDMFSGAQRLCVHVGQGVITIQAEKV
jgi:hypothetical protein